MNAHDHLARHALAMRAHLQHENADALADKLARAEQKYGYTDDWSRTGW